MLNLGNQTILTSTEFVLDKNSDPQDSAFFPYRLDLHDSMSISEIRSILVNLSDFEVKSVQSLRSILIS